MYRETPIVLVFLYTFMTMNFHGWGLLHDQRYITFVLFSALAYLFAGALRSGPIVLSRYIRMGLLMIFIVCTVFVTVAGLVGMRNKTSVEGFINDSGLQVEIAGRMLLLGKNPYTQSYENTDLARAAYSDEAGNTINPALRFNAYPPGMLMLSAAGFRIASRLLGVFDVRFVTLFFYVLLITWGLVRFGRSEKTIWYLTLVGINPLFINHLIQGSNDVIVITMLVWSLSFLEKRRYVTSAVLLGIALATKQLAWVAWPFYFLYVWRTGNKAVRIRYVILTLSVAAAIYMPFAVWDLPALVTNLVLYMSGSVPGGYPIHNFGWGMFLYATGKVASIYQYYPFWIWQGAWAVLVMTVWMRMSGKIQDPSMVMAGTAVMLGGVWFFNRFMNYSYLGTLVVLAGITYVWGDRQTKASMRE